MNNSIAIYNTKKLENSKVWLLFLLLGWSYGSMDDMGKQIFFYLTVGGLGVWFLYVLFTLNGKIIKYNKKMAIEAGVKSDDLLKLGLI